MGGRSERPLDAGIYRFTDTISSEKYLAIFKDKGGNLYGKQKGKGI